MLRLTSSSLCPFCEVHALSKALVAPWQQARGVASFQKRQPARMDLSSRVSQGPKKATPDGKPIKKSRNSPFNNLNSTTVPRELQQKAATHRAAAEDKRVARHVKGGRGKPIKSKEPMKALKMQRALANVSYEKRGRTKLELAERDRFEEFDLLSEIKESVPVQALGGLNDIAPTPIQRLAIPALLGTEDGKRRKKGGKDVAPPTRKEMQQFLLAAETGSGKTLAYLLPIIDALKRAEAFEAQQEAEAAKQAENNMSAPGQGFELPSPDVDEPHHTTGRPRVIILVPTAELVSQVGALVKSLSHTVKFRAAMISANYSSTIIRNRLFSPQGIDIVISTPHLLNSITESDPNVLSRVSHLVIDEADSLLDRSFSPLTSSIIDRATPSLQQLVLCSATIPRSLDTFLHKRYPSIRRLTTPNLHAIPRRVQLSVVDIDKIPYQGNRDLTCAQVIWDLGKEVDEYATPGTVKRIIVFVNEREKADELATYLQNKGVDATALSRDSSDRASTATLAAFTGTSTLAQIEKQKTEGDKFADSSARRLRGVKVLVTTDIASRGIDTTSAKTVILYTVPHTSIDFIHRLGRVGRMGRRGRGIVLVGRGDRKDVVREVREVSTASVGDFFFFYYFFFTWIFWFWILTFFLCGHWTATWISWELSQQQLVLARSLFLLLLLSGILCDSSTSTSPFAHQQSRSVVFGRYRTNTTNCIRHLGHTVSRLQCSATNMARPVSSVQTPPPPPQPGYGQTASHNTSLQGEAQANTATQPPNTLPMPADSQPSTIPERRRSRRARTSLSTRQALMSTLASSEPCDLFARDLQATPPPGPPPTDQLSHKSTSSRPSSADISGSHTPNSASSSSSSSQEPSPEAETMPPQPLAGNPVPQPRQVCVPPSRTELDGALAAGCRDVTITHRDRMLVVRESE
ncbi:hypothetical protein Q7P37_008147 [Cladosporium fusiforme]